MAKEVSCTFENLPKVYKSDGRNFSVAAASIWRVENDENNKMKFLIYCDYPSDARNLEEIHLAAKFLPSGKPFLEISEEKHYVAIYSNYVFYILYRVCLEYKQKSDALQIYIYNDEILNYLLRIFYFGKIKMRKFSVLGSCPPTLKDEFSIQALGSQKYVINLREKPPMEMKDNNKQVKRKLLY